MAISPRTVGDLLPAFIFTFTDDSSVVVDISGQAMSNFSLILSPMPGVNPNAARKVGVGTFAYVTNGTDGKISYTPVAADVNTAGAFRLYVVAIISAKPLTSDPQEMEFTPAP